ncbi:heme biosynthesis HemY N-terminal domain-containing protein [Chelativorans sp. AA-79]|uniref:heme biosynthesis protein HemY n=1 Tax=Chelativorans sp. AA-79 TaxID=3028735 RepID=UPI0023F79A9D|nr:heme biosynthesis HemY N-terminal domain-containing protein [Chelativorans sp. AA-79]WEX09969.1 heme biosynthesis HemY N-terminal domain-containing protein [Chelativorans sp. AA-79]
MFRILFFFVVVLLLGLGFAWLADRPGELAITFAGYRYEVTLMVAAVLLVATVAAVMILWWVIRGIWNSPYTVARYFRVRRRDRGYQALSTGLIAAGAGDGGLASRMGKQAAKHISSDQEPLIHLLDAQAAMLEGNHEAARAKFQAMAEDPETRLLGLRGLYLEAERLGEHEAARHYAAEAAQNAPQLGWAVNATLETKSEQGDWQGALALLDKQKPAGKEDREAHARRRAVLLTAQAMAQLDMEPAAARTLALEAHRLQPDFVPAAVTAARALFRQNDLRRGAKVLETVWAKSPHPEVADVYVHARPGDSTHDRLARAKKLRRLKPNNVESELTVARAALDAGEFKEARTAAEAAVRLDAREGAFLLLADIEEAETGDQGRVRHWLAKAVRAPRDPAWVADGYVSERWAPASPVTGRLDAFEWRAPMERLGQLVEGEEALQALPPVEAAPETSAGDEDGMTLDAQPLVAEEARVAEQPSPASETAPPPSVDEEEREEEEPVSPPPAPANAENGARKTAEKPPAEKREDVRPPLPDDPGVEPDEDARADEANRFRLF